MGGRDDMGGKKNIAEIRVSSFVDRSFGLASRQ